MHAKGLNQIMIDMAVKTGMPVKAGANIPPSIRAWAITRPISARWKFPAPARPPMPSSRVSEGDRRFTRYGYADLYQDGAQVRPAVPACGRAPSIICCGAIRPRRRRSGARRISAMPPGFELMEPLTFKGREGSGHPGGRCAYADKTLDPGIADWTKFAASYRLWGRLLYNPDATPDAWRRDFSAAMARPRAAAEEALANASRIMPLLTSAHLPSASNHDLEYEMAMNMPIVAGGDAPYSDTPEPKVYGHVSPLDPQLFSTIADHADDLLAGRANAKYSPVEVAAWLDGFVAASEKALVAGAQAGGRRMSSSAVWTRTRRIVNAHGPLLCRQAARRACCMKSGMKTHDPKAGALALAQYEKGRAAWAAMAERAKNGLCRRYFLWPGAQAARPLGRQACRHRQGYRGHARGHCRAAARRLRMPAQAIAKATVDPISARRCRAAMPRRNVSVRAAPLSLSLTARAGRFGPAVLSPCQSRRTLARAWRWQRRARTSPPPSRRTTPTRHFRCNIISNCRAPDAAWLYPAFNATLSNQPYYAVWKRA